MSLEDIFKDESIVPILIIVFGLLAVGILIYNRSLYNKERERFATDMAKSSEFSEAKIISKEIANNNIYCYLTFELKNGERKRFTLQKSQASLWFENDKGMLEYKGNTFVAFKRNTNGS